MSIRVTAVCPADTGGDSPSHSIDTVLTLSGDAPSRLTAEQAKATGLPADHFRCERHGLAIVRFQSLSQ